MPGNERAVVGFLIQNINRLNLDRIKVVNKIQAPGNNGDLIDINTPGQICTEHSRKKADIFLNGCGVSIKQAGPSFLYNRLQRSGLLNCFTSLKFSNADTPLSKIDDLVLRFHNGGLPSRDVHWSSAFERDDFFKLLKFLMMEGSVQTGYSDHQAEFILTAPKTNISAQNIKIHDFESYFEEYKSCIYISIRRQWVGQKSNSEHRRASGLAQKEGNQPWVFNNIVGSPRTGWRNDFPNQDRRTVYMIFITKC